MSSKLGRMAQNNPALNHNPATGNRRLAAVFGKPTFEVEQLDLDLIDPDQDNPRGADLGDLEGLAASVAEEGVRQPIYVAERGSRYRTVEGHRRVAASRLAGRQTIPAFILHGAGDDELTDLALLLNTQRENIPQNRLLDINDRYRQRGVAGNRRARLLGVSPATISLWDQHGDKLRQGVPLRHLLDGSYQPAAEAEATTVTAPTPATAGTPRQRRAKRYWAAVLVERADRERLGRPRTTDERIVLLRLRKQIDELLSDDLDNNCVVSNNNVALRDHYDHRAKGVTE